MTTMDERYGDGATKCVSCDECGMCITHGDCMSMGCGKEVTGKDDWRFGKKEKEKK